MANLPSEVNTDGLTIVDGRIAVCGLKGFREAARVLQAGSLIPKGMNENQAVAAMMYGGFIGINPIQAVQNIAVINGRPRVWGDAAIGIAYKTGRVADFKEEVTGEGEDIVATCTVELKGIKSPVVRTFSVSDAKTAGLWKKSGPWTTYPKRMLAQRARGFALRDAGLLEGLVTEEEARDIPVEVKPVEVEVSDVDDEFADAETAVQEVEAALPEGVTEEDVQSDSESEVVDGQEE